MLITGIAGAGMYVMKLRADNATLKANQIKLETQLLYWLYFLSNKQKGKKQMQKIARELQRNFREQFV